MSNESSLFQARGQAGLPVFCIEPLEDPLSLLNPLFNEVVKSQILVGSLIPPTAKLYLLLVSCVFQNAPLSLKIFHAGKNLSKPHLLDTMAEINEER